MEILLARYNQIRNKLTMLAGGRSSNYAPRPEKVHVRSGTGAVPPGVNTRADLTTRLQGPPSIDTPAEYFAWRFEQAKGDYWRLLGVCAQAEHHHETIVRGPRRPVGEDDPAAKRRVLEEYQGIPAHEVATWEGCPPRWVRRLRRENELDVDTGLPDPDISERDRQIIREVRAKVPYSKIVAKYGLPSKSAVSRILEGSAS